MDPTTPAQRRKASVEVVGAFLLTGALTLIDYQNGIEISFSIFYLLPVSWVAWRVGRRAGNGMAVLCALVWLGNDALWVPEHVYSDAWIPYWNGFMRLLIFIGVVFLLSKWKDAQRLAADAYLELDRLRQKQLRIKDDLLSHVSHELRTPLAATHQFVSILKDGIAGPLTADQEQYLGVAARNIDQLTRMIGDLLDSTRTSTGKLSVEPEPTRLEELVTDLVRTLRSPAAEKGLDLRFETDPGPLPPVLADPARIRQVITNLIDNALKFTPEGGQVTVRIASHDAGHLETTVQDTGRGIPPEAQARIFQRLFQVEHDDATSRHGLGLGLYICREIVERHHGRIWLNSQVGSGTTFHFTLPLASGARA